MGVERDPKKKRDVIKKVRPEPACIGPFIRNSSAGAVSGALLLDHRAGQEGNAYSSYCGERGAIHAGSGRWIRLGPFSLQEGPPPQPKDLDHLKRSRGLAQACRTTGRSLMGVRDQSACH